MSSVAPWLIAGGLVAVGGFVWWRSQQAKAGKTLCDQIAGVASVAGYGYSGGIAATLCNNLGGLAGVAKGIESVRDSLGLGGDGDPCTGTGFYTQGPAFQKLCGSRTASATADHRGLAPTSTATPPPPNPFPPPPLISGDSGFWK